MIQRGFCIALIGGGRWGRVHASVLRSLHPRIGRLVWVSLHNKQRLGEGTPGSGPAIEVVDSFESALQHRPDAVVICTASVNHARDTLFALERGIPCLVEKPLSLTTATATELVSLAESKELALSICLPLLMASYLQRFKAACGGRAISTLRLHWFDPAAETRYGDAKYTDITTSKVDEILPHLWSIVALLIDTRRADVLSVARNRPEDIFLALASGDTRVEANFGRRATSRIRRIDVAFTDGGHAELDFAREPGVATIDGRQVPDDGSWDQEPRPLAAVHINFLGQASDPAAAMSSPIAAHRCLDSVRLAENVRRQVMAIEAERAAGLLRSGEAIEGDSELLHLILDNLGPELAQAGIRVDPSDEAAHMRLAENVQHEVLGRARGVHSPTTTLLERDAALTDSPFVTAMVEHLRSDRQ